MTAMCQKTKCKLLLLDINPLFIIGEMGKNEFCPQTFNFIMDWYFIPSWIICYILLQVIIYNTRVIKHLICNFNYCHLASCVPLTSHNVTQQRHIDQDMFMIIKIWESNIIVKE
jgi:hypothetical protein